MEGVDWERNIHGEKSSSTSEERELVEVHVEARTEGVHWDECEVEVLVEGVDWECNIHGEKSSSTSEERELFEVHVDAVVHGIDWEVETTGETGLPSHKGEWETSEDETDEEVLLHVLTDEERYEERDWVVEGTDIEVHEGWVGGEAECDIVGSKHASEWNGPNCRDVKADDAPSNDSWIALRSDGCPRTLTLMSTTRYLQFLLPPGSELYGRDSTQLHVDIKIAQS